MLQCGFSYAIARGMKSGRHSIFYSFAVAAMLAACGGPSTSNSVWDSYDTRYPVTADVPDYNAFPVDNDSYYKAPDCSIMDSPSCGGD